MSIACHINVYNSHVDRGATVTTTPLEHYEVDESGIVVGKPLPKLWSKNTVTAYDGNQLDLEIWQDLYHQDWRGGGGCQQFL
jgi:hypothetical protein